MKNGRKWFWRGAGVLLIILLAFGINGIIKARSMGFLRAAVFETEPPRLPLLKQPAVLVFYKTNSFIHKEAIPVANQLLQKLGQEYGWSVYLTDNGAVHNARDLAKFDVLIWNNVTGDVLTLEQRAAMRTWLEQGGGFVGLHAAGDNSHKVWPWYQDSVIRTRFIGHPLTPQFQQATVRPELPADPIVSGLPNDWQRTDEWYSFEASPRSATTQILATIDESTYSPGAFFGKQLSMGDDHPIIWKHCAGQGRVFYSAMGHTAASYAEPEYRQVLQRAIAWAGKLETKPGIAGRLDTLSCEPPQIPGH